MPSTEGAGGQHLKDCRICGIIGGGGLMAAGGYIYFHARKFVRPGYTPLPVAMQIFFAFAVASLGIATFLKPAVELMGSRASIPRDKRK